MAGGLSRHAAWRLGATGVKPPRLLVLLVVDQMRADYIDRFQQQWQGGLKRLVSNGAWFRLGEYPYASTVTCAGHSSISTGTLPSTHGMIMNGWYDRGARTQVTCTADASVSNIGYGGRPVKGGDSLARLRTTTLADELRAQLDPPGHAVAFSLKARSAATLGGRSPDAIAWFDDSGTWVTSTAFSHGPVPVLSDYIAAHPIEHEFGGTWDRTLPLGRYLFETPAIGVTPLEGLTASFPHPLKGGGHRPDETFYLQWQNSPYSDEYLARMALDVARTLKFDRAGSTNLLAIGFSALDKVGHDFGPNSHEVQDVLIRLDRTLSMLFDGLDALVGPDNYTVALSADHGVAPMPERQAAAHLPAGRVPIERITAAIEKRLTTEFGPGTYVERVVAPQVYLVAPAAEKLAARPDIVARLREDLAADPGVAGIYTADELATAEPGDTSLRGRYARSYFPGRSGELTIVLRPYWIDDETGTSHGTAYSYDTRVPVIFMGAGIQAGEYLTIASPLDIAPTLASLAGVTLPRADGRVLSEALARAPAQTKDR